MQEEDDNNVAAEVAKEAAKEAARQAKQAAKEAAKKAVKDALKKALMGLAKSPYFWLAVGIILVLVIFLAGAHYVIQKSKIKSYQEDKEKITTESGFFDIGKTIFNNGVYEYQFESEEIELANKLLTAIGYDPATFTNFEKYVLVKVSNAKEDSLGQLTMDLDLQEYSEKELHLLPKFVEAELKTMYPDLGGDTNKVRDSFQGNVKIKRNDYELKYKPQKEFDKLIETNSSDVLNYFTLDEAFNLSVANGSTSTSSSQLSGDKGHVTDDGYSQETIYVKTTVPYMSVIQKFATPYSFFFTLLTITEDANFCEDVANLALKNEVELTVYDEVTTVQNKYVEEGTAKVDYKYLFKLEYDYKENDEKEKNESFAFATIKAVSEILATVDNLERAIASEQEDYEGLKKGVQMTYDGLMASLEKLGVTAYGEQGEQFDPNLHHAVMHIDDDSLDANVITDVFQKGYKYNDKVVRPAMVKTAN